MCRRRRAGQFSSAVARRRSQKIGVGGGAALAAKNFFSKIPEKISFYPQNFLMTFLSHRKLQQNKYTTTMASAARRQIIGGGSTKVGGGAHKLLATEARRGLRTALISSRSQFEYNCRVLGG